MARFHEQSRYQVRFEWGLPGIVHLAPACDVVIIVDVLSFTTCVDVATGRGALVYPFLWRDERAADFAQEKQAHLAGSRKDPASVYSLSPDSLAKLKAGNRIVLPSPNGSELSARAGDVITLAGCLRNARAVAQYAEEQSQTSLVLAAGERWPDGSLRPALEDYLGAGAVISHLSGARSPEAQAAADVFQNSASRLEEVITECVSGRELADIGYAHDLPWVIDYNASNAVPRLEEGAYRNTIA